MAPHSGSSEKTLNQPCLGLLGFGVFLASLSGARNSGFARTTKWTPLAPREGLFWSRKRSAGLVLVKMGLFFFNELPAAAVLRTAFKVEGMVRL